MQKLLKFASIYRAAVAMGQRVPRQRTVMSGKPLADALREGYKAVFGQEPTLEALGMGYSQCMHEQGGKFWNYNFGNLIAGKGWRGQYITHTKEQGLREYTATGERMEIKVQKFRAYSDPVQGAADYWRLLKRERYQEPLAWFASGDPASAAMSLSDKGYYTGNRVAYAKNMSSFFGRFMQEIAPQMTGLASAPQPPPGPRPKFTKNKADKVEIPVEKRPEITQTVQQQYAYKGQGQPQTVQPAASQVASEIGAAMGGAAIPKMPIEDAVWFA